MAVAMTAVRSLVIPVEDADLLLPGSVVAEIVPYAQPVPPAGQAPVWLLGNVAWRGQRIPLVSFEALVNGVPGNAPVRARIAVLKALSGQPGLNYFGIAARQIPRLTAVQEGTIEVLEDADIEASPAIACHVLSAGEPALIPDLAYIESELQAALTR